MKRILLAIMFYAASYPVYCQSADLRVIAAAGGESQSGKTNLQWTLGEMQVNTLTTAHGLITQGYHQPIVLGKAQPAITDWVEQYTIQIAPNPVQDILHITITAPFQETVQLLLTDAGGRKVLQETLPGTARSRDINLVKQPSGLYILQLYGTAGTPIRTYKIIKQ